MDYGENHPFDFMHDDVYMMGGLRNTFFLPPRIEGKCLIIAKYGHPLELDYLEPS